MRAGMTFDEMQFELGVATQCGRCEGCARDVVAQCSVSHPMAALSRDDGPAATRRAADSMDRSVWDASPPSGSAAAGSSWRHSLWGVCARNIFLRCIRAPCVPFPVEW
ncbi:MAG: hypothetical protein NVSMB34_02720 [Variovorax sp.]